MNTTGSIEITGSENKVGAPVTFGREKNIKYIVDKLYEYMDVTGSIPCLETFTSNQKDLDGNRIHSERFYEPSKYPDLAAAKKLLMDKRKSALLEYGTWINKKEIIDSGVNERFLLLGLNSLGYSEKQHIIIENKNLDDEFDKLSQEEKNIYFMKSLKEKNGHND